MRSFVGVRARIAWIVVFLFPIVLNSAELLDIFKADPVLRFSGLQTGIVAGPLNIHASFDPSIGIVFQPLGRRSAEELLHGTLPWWNSLQGIGAPLAGEMSPGSFFPLIFLELLPNGQTILDVAVQILAGAFMLLLARRLGLGAFAATVAAVLFEANGTFAWLNSGWCYPLPFLPLLLYGVELTVGKTERERVAGLVLVAVAVAVSISAAMLEVAYLDGLLAVAWAVLRLIQRRNAGSLESLMRMLAGAALGLLLAAPLLVAFGDFLRISYVGMHSGLASSGTLDLRPLAQMVAPYIVGPVFYHDSGYAGVAVALAAVCGLFGRSQRGVRVLLGLWIFVSFGATIGLPIVQDLFAKIPGVNYTAYFRYIDGSWEFALAILAASFVDDLTAHVERMWTRCALATAAVIFTIASGLIGAADVTRASFARPDYAVWCWTSVAWCLAGIAGIWLLTLRDVSNRLRSIVVASVLVLEASINYLIPTFGYPLQGKLVEGSVAFLQQHLGLQRSFSLGPIAQQYGSYFHVAELDDAELPVAKSWADYMTSHLDALTEQGWVGGQHPEQIAKNIDAFEGAGTKYVFTYLGVAPFANFYEPISSSVPGQIINLPDGNDPLHARLDNVPRGTLAAVAILNDNNSGRADGVLHVHVCADGQCVDGRRSFAEAPDNQHFSVELERPLIIRSGRVDIAMSQENATINDAIWLYGRDPASNETMTSDGKVLTDQIANIALAYGSLTGEAVVVRARKSVANGKSAMEADVSLPGDETRYVTALGIAGLSQTSNDTSIHACSQDTCETAARTSAGNPGESWFAFAHPIATSSSLAVTLEGRSTAQLRVRLELSAEHPNSVYHDSLVEVFEMPHPAPYFSAPDCVIVPRDREHLAAQCSRASTLTRRELYMPGWNATLNNAAVPVTPIHDVFESIPLPSGSSFIDFSFVPPFMEYGYAAFWFALLTLAYQIVAYVRLRGRAGEFAAA